MLTDALVETSAVVVVVVRFFSFLAEFFEQYCVGFKSSREIFFRRESMMCVVFHQASLTSSGTPNKSSDHHSRTFSEGLYQCEGETISTP